MSRSRDSQSVRPAVLVDDSQPDEAGSASQDEWLARLRAGDPIALDRFARAEAPRIAGLLVRILGPRADLEDLVQVVFLETCKSLPRFRGDGSLSSFVSGVAVHVARRAMRPGAWFTRRSHVEFEPVASDDPERSTQQAEQLHHLHRALARIAPKKRIAFALWALEGLDLPAIAELTGASVSATKSRIFYAQKELRAMVTRDRRLRELLYGGDDGAG